MSCTVVSVHVVFMREKRTLAIQFSENGVTGSWEYGWGGGVDTSRVWVQHTHMYAYFR